MKFKMNKISRFILLLLFSASGNLLYSQWQPDIRLTSDTAESNGTNNNAKWIAAGGNNIHIVWLDKRTGTGEIYYKKSTDNGVSWGSDVKINDVVNETNSPAIAISGSNVHIVWSDARNGAEEIYYARSTNWGNAWNTNFRLTNAPFVSGSPVVSCEGSFVNIAWTDLRDGNAEIYYKNSTDNGTNWSSDLRLTNAPDVSQLPAIGQTGNNIHIVWDDWRNGVNKELYYKRSTNGGLTWSSDIMIANNPLTVWGQTLSVSGTYLHLAYEVQVTANRFDIFYKNSSDAGLTWSTESNLTNSLNSSGSPAIYSYGSVIHLVWLESITGNNLFYKRSTNNGLNWSSDTGITNNSLNPYYPSIAASNSSIHVVWQDSRDGNKEIYYKSNLTGNAPFTVSGLVTFKDNNQPVNSGYVKALKYISETTEIITIDSAAINPNGTYILNNVPDDVFDLMFYQDDDLLQFVPTYYVSTIDWRLSTKIHPTQNLTNINCQVYRINNQTNPYNISGQITANTDNPAVTSMKDAVVYAKIGDAFKNYGISGSSGSYVATKLPPGNYTLITYRMGFAPVSQNVIITNGSLSNINFDLGSPLIGINIINENIPEKYSLSQNYPNPFNPFTTIKFEIPALSLIKLSVFDILGREIETLLNDKLNAGTYSVNWNASSYPSGIYFYRIETAGYTDSKKMILLK